MATASAYPRISLDDAVSLLRPPECYSWQSLKAIARDWGMLLYPVVSTRLRLLYDELQSFRVRVCTVDLGKDWQTIRNELLAILEWVAAGDELAVAV